MRVGLIGGRNRATGIGRRNRGRWCSGLDVTERVTRSGLDVRVLIVSIQEDGPRPPAFVTGKLSVSYLKPASIDEALELRARVVDRSERRANVVCRVLQGGIECAIAEVVTVRVKKVG